MEEIYLDTPRWLYSKRNSDWQLKLKLQSGMRDYGLVLPGNILFDIVYNLKFIVLKLAPVRFHERIEIVFAGFRAAILTRLGVKHLITQGPYPPLPRNCTIVWETYFLEPEGEARNEFKRGANFFWLKQMERYGGLVDRIAVRGTHSLELVQRMYPEYARKVVDLRFVQPEYQILQEREVVRKQSATGLVEVLFIGREARRKGLPNLIKAMQKLREGGVAGFRLRIVSTLRDGRVDIPDVNWIEYKFEVSHDEVMRLMAEAQVFIMPSRFESYGLVYLEAMAGGCAVVVPNAEPQLEFIDYGNAGMSVDTQSIDNITDALRKLITDQGFRMQLAVCANRRYVGEFAQPHVRKAWQEMLQSLRDKEK